jgi:hypothetical protein
MSALAIKLYDIDAAQAFPLRVAARGLLIAASGWLLCRFAGLGKGLALVYSSTLVFAADRLLVGIVTYRLWYPETGLTSPHPTMRSLGLSAIWIGVGAGVGWVAKSRPLVGAAVASWPVLIAGRRVAAGGIVAPGRRPPLEIAGEWYRLRESCDKARELLAALKAARLSRDEMRNQLALADEALYGPPSAQKSAQELATLAATLTRLAVEACPLLQSIYVQSHREGVIEAIDKYERIYGKHFPDFDGCQATAFRQRLAGLASRITYTVSSEEGSKLVEELNRLMRDIEKGMHALAEQLIHMKKPQSSQ